MPEQPVREANDLLALAIQRSEQGQVHKGVTGHLIAARVHLDAVTALLSLPLQPTE